MLSSLNHKYSHKINQQTNPVKNSQLPASTVVEKGTNKSKKREELRESNSALLKLLDSTEGIGKPYVPINKWVNRGKFSNLANAPHYLYQAYRRKIPAQEILLELFAVKHIFGLLHKMFGINQFKDYDQYRVFPYMPGDAQRIYGRNLDNPNHLAHQQEIDDLKQKYSSN